MVQDHARRGAGENQSPSGEAGTRDPRSSIWWAIRALRWWEKAYLLVAVVGLATYILLRWVPLAGGP